MSKKEHKIPRHVQYELTRYFQKRKLVSLLEMKHQLFSVKRLKMLCSQYIKHEFPRVNRWEYVEIAYEVLRSRGELSNVHSYKPGASKTFYESDEWRQLRYRVLKLYDRKCMCCGRSPDDHQVILHVDHIKPRSLYPELALEINNLQILCEDCNLGKLNFDDNDYRPKLEVIK